MVIWNFLGMKISEKYFIGTKLKLTFYNSVLSNFIGWKTKKQFF